MTEYEDPDESPDTSDEAAEWLEYLPEQRGLVLARLADVEAEWLAEYADLPDVMAQRDADAEASLRAILAEQNDTSTYDAVLAELNGDDGNPSNTPR